MSDGDGTETPMDAQTDGRRMRAVLVLAATLAFVTAPFWSNGFGGFDPNQYPVPQIDPPIQPAGYAFGIWGVIYVWLVCSALFGLVLRGTDAGWNRTRWPLIVSLAVGAPWISVALFSPLWATVMIWIMLLSALVALFRAPRRDWWILQGPLALYAGWLTAASLVATALLGAGYGVWTESLGWAWAALLTALVIGIAVQRNLARQPFYGAAIAWALVAVAVNAADKDLGVVILAGVGAAAIAWTALRGMRKASE